jgi:hypothetical protein
MTFSRVSGTDGGLETQPVAPAQHRYFILASRNIDAVDFDLNEVGQSRPAIRPSSAFPASRRPMMAATDDQD